MTDPTSRLQRGGDDACPGVIRPFVAADGSIVRLRPAARPVGIQALWALLDVLAGQDDPAIQLTSRGALQVRGLPVPVTPRIRDAIRATGLVPSASHELVRNVVASPLSGLDEDGRCDLRPIVGALDDALCADPVLTRLGGRFLFALDDGRGDVIGESFDLGVLATGSGGCVVLAGGVGRGGRGWEAPLDGAVPLLVELARGFVERASGDEAVWHVDQLAAPLGPEPTAEVVLPSMPDRPLGAVAGHAVVAVPLGSLRRHHLEAVAEVAERLLVTPWRSLVVENAAGALPDLERAGFATRRDSPWHRLHACTGAPGCARSALDTRAFARRLVPVLPTGVLPVHLSGCERRCGTPATAYVDLLAPSSLDAALTTIHASPETR